MEAILKFNLPEDQEEFNNAVKADDYKFVLNKFREHLRTEVKYNEALSKTERKTLQRVWDDFNRILINNEITL